MEQIISLFPEKIAYAISNTVLHSLWQISIIALVYFIFIKLKKQTSSQLKYKAALLSLFLSLVCSVISFIYLYITASDLFVEQQVISLSTVAFSSTIIESGTFSIEHFLYSNQSSIAALWLSGTILLLLRFIAGILKIATLKSTASPSQDKRLSYLVNTISSKLNISKLVEIKESALIRTPVVLGHIKPIILFPVAVSTQLSMNEIEAILAHELAHVMRNDYILNLIQSFAEVLLYFHPCIWWLSSIVREERENCCDDVALNFIEDNLSYAKSLVKLQKLQMQTIPSFALAFSGSKNHLKNRIMRILNQSSPTNFLREKLIAIALLFTFVLTFANNSTNEIIDPEVEQDVNCELEDVLAQEEFSNISYSLILEDDTIPEKNALIIKKKNKSESIDMKMEDGEITELKIDGEVIPEDRYEEYSDRFHIDGNSGLTIHSQDFNFDDEDIILNGMPFSFSDGSGIYMFSDSFPGFDMNNNFDFDSIFSKSSEQMKNALKILGEAEDDRNTQFKFLEQRIEEMNIDSLLSGRINNRRFPFNNDGNTVLKRYHFNSPQDLAHNNFDFHNPRGSKNTLKSKMSRELQRDNFLIKGENKVELSGKNMKINGEKQPSNIWNKYKKVYEKYIGAELTRESKIVLEIDFDGKDNRFFKSI